MPCYSPLKAIKSSSGVSILPADAPIWSMKLPCGQCIGCRLERSRQWAMRCMHESKSHEHNCFITLTYDDEHVPHDGGLHYRDFQLFMKRLRKYFPNQSIRYYMCGEYGGDFGRPHFHAILFNLTFTDLTLWRKSNSGNSLFRSATLESLWPYGYSSIGAVTLESCAYVARYIMKKITGQPADLHYSSVNTITGEIFHRRPEFNKMSLKPAIGATWFKQYSSDVFPHDHVIIDGTPTRPPRFYDKLLKRVNPDLYNDIKAKRILDATIHLMDNTPRRLEAKRIVAEATLSQLPRGLLK